MKNWFKYLTVLFFPVLASAQTAIQPAGSGTVGDPYQVSSVDNLYWISANIAQWNKVYVQTVDIDASSTSGWNGGSGFSPIGFGTQWTGSYDGQNHVIDGLVISRSATDYGGLFGNVGSASVIKNLGLTNCLISGKQYTGALAGYNTGQITNCFTTGMVSGYYAVGGLVGYNSLGVITASFSNATVTCSTDRVGGLVGYNNGSGTTISNCYATGNATATGIRAGGLLGYNNGGTVTNSFSTGIPTAASSTGGLTGGPNATGTTNSFWDTETSTRVLSPGGGTGLTTLQMKTETTFTNAGWDFETETTNGTNDYWTMDGVTNSGYPYLKWQELNAASLPVELSSFTGKISGGNVILNWSTASEKYNAGWEVQIRNAEPEALEGSALELSNQDPSRTSGSRLEWETIGFVSGKGTTTEAQNYVFSSPVTRNLSPVTLRLKQLDLDGTVSYSQILTLDISATAFSLEKNYPNPFNPSTTIRYQLPAQVQVTLSVFDVTGRLISVLENELKPVGFHQVEFNAAGFSSGVYYYQIKAGNDIKTGKMLLAK
ncbi:MAG: T9SS type A sorting domain-containing protein [Bacteroidetes bacterium]|nr:T9SS type A sorting domain-containing protein [Bacteroidota bacterium]